MGTNPETRMTNAVRTALVAMGAHVIKLSDTFTRGVPDCLIVGERLIMAEFKVDRGVGRHDTRTWKQLRMTGAQDHHIRAICCRSLMGSCVVTALEDGTCMTVWLPVHPLREGEGFENYRAAARGRDAYAWLMSS